MTYAKNTGSITEVFTDDSYIALDGERVLLTIKRMENNVYFAKNADCSIVCEVVPLDDYRTLAKVIEYRRRGKDGKYRNTTKLLDHNRSWLVYILEEKGFIRKAKAS